jgi:hypothetical protein
MLAQLRIIFAETIATPCRYEPSDILPPLVVIFRRRVVRRRVSEECLRDVKSYLRALVKIKPPLGLEPSGGWFFCLPARLPD